MYQTPASAELTGAWVCIALARLILPKTLVPLLLIAVPRVLLATHTHREEIKQLMYVSKSVPHL